jgi:ABC-2 type transport system ATP-binding protein
VVSRSWFVRRRVGFGARPSSWQGWLITVVALGAIVGGLVGLKRPANEFFVVGVALLYQAIAYSAGGLKRRIASVDGATIDDESATLDHPTVSVDTDTTFESKSASELASAIVSKSGRFAEERSDDDAKDAVIVVKNLTKQFGSRVAFENVSFNVHRGEVFGFLGPNGAGKTTTVRSLSTLIAPTSGVAHVAGLELTATNGFDIRQRIAVMTEVPGLYLRLTVNENLEFFAGLYGYREAQSRIDAALEAVNLSSRKRDLCGSLSKGLRQRVGLARALLNDPEIVFLDEPTAGLDPVASLEVHDLINALRTKGVTIFLTTHRLDEAEKLCDRVAILNTTLRTVGRIDDLRQRMFRKAIVVTTVDALESPEQLFASLPTIEGWKRDESGSYILTVTDVRVAAPDVTRALVGVGADVLSIVESRHSLEEVYLELVGDAGRKVTA